jgi:diguanylate cyclase (GGDEF)-like protein/PAS domain S-box-containing protein
MLLSWGLTRVSVVIALSCAALVAVIWATAVERVAYERGEAVRDAVATSSNLALAFEEQTVRALKSVEQALRFVSHQYLERGARLDERMLLAGGVLDFSVFRHIDVLDARADSVLRPLGKRVNGADREFFRDHRDSPSSELRIGEPTLGRVTGRSAIHMTRRIDNADGSFGGLALASVDPEFFTSFYESISIGDHGLIQLVGLDGVVRARRAGQSSTFGQNIGESTLFAELASRKAGNHAIISVLDGVERYTSYRMVRGYPLVVAVGISVDEALDGFHARHRMYYLGSSLATMFVLLVGGGVAIALRRRQAGLDDLKRSEERYRATFDQAAVGVAHVSLQGAFLKVNGKLCDMLGYSEAELLARTFADVTHPDDLAATEDLHERLRAGASVPEIEKRYVHKSGAILWTTLAAASLRGARGRPEYFVAVVQDVTERKRAQERLLHQAHYDALTELPNRVLFGDRLAQALSQARRKGWTVGVIFFDLDRFKTVNDTLGHMLGDALLRDAAKRLAGCMRAGDTAARVGGDEFAVILSELSRAQDAAIVARKIIDAMAAPHLLEGHEVFVTSSLGIATFPGDGQDAATLVKNADAAMLRAKQVGRNNYQFYTAAMTERAMENLKLDSDLRRALQRGEFLLHFQPKASLATGRITGLEALLRWQRPGNGLVAPGEFVPLLEDSGLIVPIGDWIVDAACAQLRAWLDAGVKAVPVAVNLSAKQFLHHDIGAAIESALRRHGIDAGLLEVEITESDAMRNPDEVVVVLRGLRQAGMRIAIDDFGTGYSSLAYLKRFPLDALKLDSSFVTGLPGDGDDVSIALAVIGMAHSLGLKVIAEGVETEAQRAFLAENGCDQIQGYLLARPLPAEECAPLLQINNAPGATADRRRAPVARSKA